VGSVLHGESQRQNPVLHNRQWAMVRQTYTDIQKGLNGILEKQENFEESWRRKAEAEMKSETKDDRWETWWDVETLNEAETLPPLREPKCLIFPNSHPDR
jgi:hypothetical protein